MKLYRRHVKGFTLVELITITALIAVLISGVIAVINPIAQLDKAQDARRKSDLAEIQKGLDLYYQDNGRYPASTGTYQITGAAWNAAWSPYMGRVPQDPTPATRTYVYFASANGQSYWLYANLARGAKDSQSCTGGNDCPSVPAANACGTGKACNFGLSSPNVSP